MQRLIEGFHRFRQGYFAEQHELYERLAAEGQRPRAMVIGCSDSRVDPERLFQAAPGELFILRNIANLVPPYQPDEHYHGASAAIEFGVRALEVQDLVVLGHAHCGGVSALLRDPAPPQSDFIGNWMSIASPACLAAASATPDQAHRLCEHETVRISLRNLHTFPWIEERIADGRLRIHGCWFDLASGELVQLRE
jgi:carbonic anhydrase